MEIIQDVVEGKEINQCVSSLETVLVDDSGLRKKTNKQKLVASWLYPVLLWRQPCPPRPF